MCWEHRSRIFVQYMCIQDQSELDRKISDASYCVYIEIVSAFIVLVFAFLALKFTKEIAERYDESTVSPSDYTIYIPVEKEINNIFRSVYFDPTSDLSPGVQFNEILLQHIQKLEKTRRLNE